MKKWLVLWISLISLLLPKPPAEAQAVRRESFAAPEKPGCRVWINWTDYKIRATGRGAPRAPGAHHHAPYHAAARARQQAYRLILQAGKSLQLTSTQTVEAYVGDNLQLLAEFENLAKQASVVQTEFLSTGPVEVTLELPLTGAFASLMLPDTVTRLEEINGGESRPEADASAYTGLVVDARGLAVEPAMCFQLLDEDGSEVYGPAYASRENVVAGGMCRYVADIEKISENPRVGENPLIVKAIRVRPPGASDIVISDTDASRLKSSVAHLAFLRNCRVLVVLEPPASD
jgi:hypothetical protein